MDGDVLKKGGRRPPFLFADLLTQTQLSNDRTVAVDVLLGQIVKQASALTDHHQKAAAGVVVVLVNTQVLGQLVDSGGQNSDLDLGRTGVAGMEASSMRARSAKRASASSAWKRRWAAAGTTGS